MGLTGVKPSDLPWLDTGGLQNFLQQIVDQLQRQHDALEDFQDQLGAHAISVGIDGVVRGSLRSSGNNGADAASGSHGEGLITTRGRLTESMQTLANRLAKVEATQAEHQANISSQLHSFVQKSEARHAADRDWISQELRGHQDECLGELNRSSQALEARVRVGESKASECRRSWHSDTKSNESFPLVQSVPNPWHQPMNGGTHGIIHTPNLVASLHVTVEATYKNLHGKAMGRPDRHTKTKPQRSRLHNRRFQRKRASDGRVRNGYIVKEPIDEWRHGTRNDATCEGEVRLCR